MQPEPEGERDQTDSQLRSPWRGSRASRWVEAEAQWRYQSMTTPREPDTPYREAKPAPQDGESGGAYGWEPWLHKWETDNSRKGDEGAGGHLATALVKGRFGNTEKRSRS